MTQLSDTQAQTSLTVDEVKQMCHDSGLTTQRVHEDDSGITVVATKD